MHLSPKTTALAPLLGYGFLYAWGYLCWETPALQMKSVLGGQVSLAWLVSACVTPALLFALAVVGTRRDLERYPLPGVALATSVCGVVLTLVSRSEALDAAGGALMGVASSCFAASWSLAFTHYDAAAIESTVPLSFFISLVCAVASPGLTQVPAALLAVALSAACFACLGAVGHNVYRSELGALSYDGSRDIDTAGQYGRAAVARMLAFAVAAWAVSSLGLGFCDLPAWVASAPVDVVSASGYAFAVGGSLMIVAFSVRVDFQALARATAVPMVALIALAGFSAPETQLASSVLGVAVSSTFEVILVLFFVRVAQRKGSRRGFWVCAGASAAYLGVLLGTVAGALVDGAASTPLAAARACLAIACVYVAVTALIPHRRPFLKSSEQETARQCPAHEVQAGAAIGVGAACEQDPIDAACMRLAEEFGLSPREGQVCALLAHGRTQTYIRDALFLSKSTVSTHARHVYEKLGVHSKQELIDLAESRSGEGAP